MLGLLTETGTTKGLGLRLGQHVPAVVPAHVPSILTELPVHAHPHFRRRWIGVTAVVIGAIPDTEQAWRLDIVICSHNK